MNIKGINFKFGAYNNEFGPIGLSHLGICVRSKDGMVAYDSANEELVNVDMASIQSNSMLFMMPVAIKDVKEGDVIIFNSTPLIIKKQIPSTKGIKFEAVDPKTNEEKIVIPVKNMFGFNFLTKIVSPFSDMVNTVGASEDNPFGTNILPLLLMSDDNPFSDGSDTFSTLMFMNYMSGNKTNMFENMDPMMLMLLLSKGGSNDKDFFKIMLLSQMMQKTLPNSLSSVSEEKE